MRDHPALDGRNYMWRRLLPVNARSGVRISTAEDRAVQFRALVLPLLGYLNRLAIALTGDRQSAENLVQDSVLRGLRYFDTFPGGEFRTWMAAIMSNLHRGWRTPAAKPVDEELLAKMLNPAVDDERSVLAGKGDARLRKLVAGLPEHLREALVLRELAELSYAQIAAVLEVPVGIVMSRISQARGTLRAAWLASK